jgi:hypothetical protein
LIGSEAGGPDLLISDLSMSDQPKKRSKPLSEIQRLKQELKELKCKEKERLSMNMKDTEAILSYLQKCIENPLHPQIPISGKDKSMSLIILSLNKLAKANNERHEKEYKDKIARIKLISKYQKYYAQALYYSSGIRLEGFTPIQYQDFFFLQMKGEEVWPLACYLN